MKTTRKYWIGLALLALALLMPMFMFAQAAETPLPDLPAASDNNPPPPPEAPKGKVVIDMEDMGMVITFVLLIGGIIKNFLPKVDNNLIPLITWVLGALLYQALSGGWTDIRQWMLAAITVSASTGLHSATRSTVAAIPATAAKVGLFLALLTIPLAGCGTTVQVKEGHDPIVVHAEYLEENGLNILNEFLKWESQHGAAWLKKNPGIHQFADSLRADKAGEIGPGERHLIELGELKKQYKRDKTAANGDKVKLATQTVLNLINTARSHMNLPPLGLPGAQPSVRDLMKNAPTNAPPN